VQVTNEKTENSQTFLTIEMEPSELEESLENSYQSLVKKARIPGFRKGKAPRSVLERYLGKESLLEDALNNLVPDAYERAIKEQEIEAFAQPQIEITQTEPLIFKAIVPLKPQITLGDYQKIRVVPEPVEVGEDAVGDVLEQLRHQHATWEPVERPVDFGNMAVLDVDSSIEEEPFINQKGAQFRVLKDISFPAPGFAEQIAGMKKDEEKEFNLEFPSDYTRTELAGKEASFKVVVNEIKEEILPELSDEFAREVNPDYETLDKLREEISSEMRSRAEERNRLDYEEKVIDAVVDTAEVEYPPILVEAEIHQILNQRFRQGSQELEGYLKAINKTEEELHEELHPVAIKRVARSLVLEKIIESENIKVEASEVDAEIISMKEKATGNKEELEKLLDTPGARQSIEQGLISRKAMHWLVDMAKGPKKTRKAKKEVK